MNNAACPHCGKETISLSQRLITGHWIDTYCSECSGRVSMNPIILFVMYFLLLWDLFFFGFMAYVEKSIIYLSLMIVGWLIMEVFIYYVPLVALRPKKKK
ncbi:MAG: hypothetical protein OEZ43_02705 [Gammaproteobacteria bacterium]|nr:hypothetical protein [Gammaproteobacteria bacterium]